MIPLVLWSGLLLMPLRLWLPRESFDANTEIAAVDQSQIRQTPVTVVIPARNEAGCVAANLRALAAQGDALKIIVVDDHSEDGTAQAVASLQASSVTLIRSQPLPPGWTGKLWALEQGRKHVVTPLTVLLDADIRLRPDVLTALAAKMRRGNIQLISLMATLPMQSFWERLLLPAFVYFFRIVYPFSLCNDPRYPRIAAAAGGCIMLETRILDELGGFAPQRDALIDDCTLAARVKARGYRTWIGLTHSVRSTRSNSGIRSIWNMVARTAFAQLRFSALALIGVSLLMLLMFVLPVAGLMAPRAEASLMSGLVLGLMTVSYIPTLRYYKLPGYWALTMPLIGVLYLAMTWSSAIRHWRGQGAGWKGRAYANGGQV